MLGPLAWLIVAVAPEPTTEATEPAAAVEEETSHEVTIVWEAGAAPIKPSEYMDALMQRLPPERFKPVPAGSSEDAWVVKVQQPKPGIYRLEVTPPGRPPEARRLNFEDPVVARRRLAILTAFVLEQGRLPEIVEGSGIEADETPVEPETPEDEEPDPTDEPKDGEDAKEASPRALRLLWSVGGAAVFPTTPRGVAVTGTPGYGADLDLGLRVLALLWTGAVGGYSAHPGPEMVAHRAQGGVFLGVRPQLQRWHIGARLTFVGGSLVGVLGERSVDRPYFAGGLDVQGGWKLRPDNGLAIFVGARTEIASRASTFTRDADGDGARGVGFGRARFGVRVGLAWMSPGARKRR